MDISDLEFSQAVLSSQHRRAK